MLTAIALIAAEVPMQAVPQNPCQPSPCGPNAVCQVRGDSPSCTCLPDYTGSPPNCRPECVSNNECPSHMACVRLKCRDPCPGSCGSNAECRVVSHTPNCLCPAGFTGDPFTQCLVQQSKNLNISWKLHGLIMWLQFVNRFCFCLFLRHVV